MAASSSRPATGGVAVALDALMRERGGVWIAHGAGQRRSRQSWTPIDTVRVPPESPSYQLRRLWLGPEEFAATTADSRTKGLWPLCHVVDVRPTVPRRRLGRPTRRSTHSFAAGDRRPSSAATDTPGLHPGLPPGPRGAARCARGGPMPGPRSSGTSRGRIRIGCASARGAATCSWGCSPTTCSRFSWNATGAISWPAVEDELGAEIEADGVRVRVPGTHDHGRVGADRRGLTTASRRSAGDPALADRAGAARDRCSTSTLDIDRARRRSSRLHRRAFPSGWTRSIGCSRAGPICAAG